MKPANSTHSSQHCKIRPSSATDKQSALLKHFTFSWASVSFWTYKGSSAARAAPTEEVWESESLNPRGKENCDREVGSGAGVLTCPRFYPSAQQRGALWEGPWLARWKKKKKKKNDGCYSNKEKNEVSLLVALALFLLCAPTATQWSFILVSTVCNPHTLFTKWPKTARPWELEGLSPLSAAQEAGSLIWTWWKTIPEACHDAERGKGTTSVQGPTSHLCREHHRSPDAPGSPSSILPPIKFSLRTLCPRHCAPINIFKKCSYL